MSKRILINPDLCEDCGICELVCACIKTGQWNPALARIRVINDDMYNLNVPVLCAHCENPPCAVACLMNVISKDPISGWTVRQGNYCIGCHACELACPFGSSCFDFLNGVVANCDLCGGEPNCVDHCPNNALEFVEVADGIAHKREDKAQLVLLDKSIFR